jgi:molybdate transport system permease protein
VSTEIFSLVETMDYTRAHWLAGGMLVFSFAVLAGLNTLQRRRDQVLP